ncbi:hypothetical protein CONPUDRAFT_73875 [Coniophora puteana RWD-64-598 SS2]|uniref:Uncharacterized protein n=1 Tax=Coniophora puteana (strain RWD-64-598) TaxID=741705 RepID=A0A5M3MNW3_CONPW|nr:uncharacterized protein CONPUDRAFT_73875 [Coniophora puteana RWD-64-598 SS2]EIW80862.1 hypothetical protein CONPUDRAFT_73875 [Coniophora puteana RWD-64-598 SS2]
MSSNIATASPPYRLGGDMSSERRDIGNARPLDMCLATQIALTPSVVNNHCKNQDTSKDTSEDNNYNDRLEVEDVGMQNYGSMSWVMYNKVIHNYTGEPIPSPIDTLPSPESLRVLLVWDELSGESRFRENGAFSISFYVHGGGQGHRKALRLIVSSEIQYGDI